MKAAFNFINELNYSEQLQEHGFSRPLAKHVAHLPNQAISCNESVDKVFVAVNLLMSLLKRDGVIKCNTVDEPTRPG